MRGLVVRNTGSLYQIFTEEGEYVDCKIKGSFRLKDIKTTNPIAVGDHVIIERNDNEIAYITDIEPRKNYIIRRSSNLSKQAHIIAANLDLVLLVATVNYPITTTTFIDRFLATAEAYTIPAVIIFNKTDRYKKEDKEYLDAIVYLYETIGYPCYPISARHDEDLQVIKNLLIGKTTLFSGHSGVGKSTLINRLIPGMELKTGEMSEYHNKGMHTTTFSEMISIPEGGYIIDTPGIKGFGIFDMDKDEISHYFPEIFKFSHQCRFNNCTHRKEPGCAVLQAVEDAYISESRYRSYLSMMDDEKDGKYREAF